MRQLKGDLILLLTAIIWGSSFVTQKLGMNYIEPFTFGAARFLLGSLALVPVIMIFDKMNRKNEKVIVYKNKDLIVGGLLCGSALFVGASFQQWGIVETTAGKAGFITALYIVVVPILGLFMKKRVSLLTWFGVGLACVGLYMLSITEGLTLQRGDALVLGGTFFWALQIVFVDLYVDKVDGIKLSCVQFITAGVLSTIAALIFETPNMEAIMEGSLIIVYTAIMVVGVAYTLQIIGQKYTSPAIAAIILSMESVFAVVSGALFLNERMSTRELFGCALVFIAVVVAQLKPDEVKAVLDKRLKRS